MTDLYFIVEYVDGEETWRSSGYKERRLAERIGQMKEKTNPEKIYRLELQQPKDARKW